MKKAINIWHYISVYLAGLAALIALFAPVDPVQKCLLASITILFLHFFEEFGYGKFNTPVFFMYCLPCLW